ncbi:NUDIX domain-containing protein [Puniceicoccaceae bacterium K14]|nr:NUDIX domain-containing protein [Puniceicoccaceae bacterium K14]
MSNYEIGVLPLTRDKKKVVIVTTKNGSKWIFPKGHTEKGRKDESVALDEAYEEAGLIGTIDSPFVEFCFKNGKENYLRLFPMRIDKILSNWPEAKDRKRQVLPIEQAKKLLPQELQQCLEEMS